jgi:hypothetical protein
MVESLVYYLGYLLRVQHATGPLGHRLDGIQLVIDFMEDSTVNTDQVPLYLSR